MGKSFLVLLLGVCLVFLIPSSWVTPAKALVLDLFLPLKKAPAITVAQEMDSSKIALEKQVRELQDEVLQQYNEIRSLTKKLSGLTDFIETQPSALKIKEHYKIITADVIIHGDSSAWRRSIILNRGSTSGIEKGLPVVSGRYLIGKTGIVTAYTSQVELITDPGFHARAFTIASPNPAITQTNKTKTISSKEKLQSGEGILEGISLNQCSMKWVDRDIPVEPDWLVFSASDITGLYPRGLIIGRVVSVSEEGYFRRLKVMPATDLSALESVFVLKNK
jgi:cell shape-determining protein MreC